MKEIKIVVRGRELDTSVESELLDGHVLVPLQETAHALGIIGREDDNCLKLQGEQQIIVCPDQAFALVGNSRETLPVATKLKEGKLLVPAKAIASWLGIKVLWEQAAKALIFLQKEQSLVGKRIVLDPGHGGKDPGAVGEVLTEKDFNLALVKRLGKLLEGAGAEVVYTRGRDLYLSLKRRAQIADEQEPELFLSIHSNHFHNPAFCGTETYYFNSWQGQRLANAIQRELTAELGTEDRGVREASFYLLRSVKAPAALVKVLYLSSPQEELLACDSWFRQRSALALYRGIKGFFH